MTREELFLSILVVVGLLSAAFSVSQFFQSRPMSAVIILICAPAVPMMLLLDAQSAGMNLYIVFAPLFAVINFATFLVAIVRQPTGRRLSLATRPAAMVLSAIWLLVVLQIVFWPFLLA